MNIHQYLANKLAQLTSTATIDQQGNLTIQYQGRIFTAPEFDCLYPVDIIKIDWQGKESKGTNNNKKVLFIHNKKSY